MKSSGKLSQRQFRKLGQDTAKMIGRLNNRHLDFFFTGVAGERNIGEKTTALQNAHKAFLTIAQDRRLLNLADQVQKRIIAGQRSGLSGRPLELILNEQMELLFEWVTQEHGARFHLLKKVRLNEKKEVERLAKIVDWVGDWHKPLRALFHNDFEGYTLAK